jgi:hypothetical protein
LTGDLIADHSLSRFQTGENIANASFDRALFSLFTGLQRSISGGIRENSLRNES